MLFLISGGEIGDGPRPQARRGDAVSVYPVQTGAYPPDQEEDRRGALNHVHTLLEMESLPFSLVGWT
jgi:hypothetical protein